MILDGHIHLGREPCDRAALGARMAEAGVDGGVLLSLPPGSMGDVIGTASVAERLDDLFAWCACAPNLYPFFWIDPTTTDARAQVRAMRTFEAIAQAGKPILFHSGILWDGKPSSSFNRPAEFECLLEVRGLRFCLAHISWPWCDELIAVYGKFQNALTRRSDLNIEMYVDITPGTPPIYRRDALTKLFGVGYDIEHNVIFGSDCTANAYNVGWVREWMERDRTILADLDVRPEVIDAVFGENLLRFLGLH